MNQSQFLKRSIFQLIGVRDVIAQHSSRESELLKKYACGKKNVVEIGVAEGASAAEILDVMNAEGTLYLIDPYPPGRFFGINFQEIIANRHISKKKSEGVVWLKGYSYDISRKWNKQIDFLFIDGDHSYEICRRDWDEWSQFVADDGIVVFHDARLFDKGWTTPETGPVKLVNKLFRSKVNIDWEIIDEIDSMVVVRKRENVR